MHATIESVGLVAAYMGDDNQNNIASIWYRPVGTSAWLAGHEMFADRSARQWRGSLVYLSAGTEYEIEVRFTDPDGVVPDTVKGSIRTRPDYPDVGSGGNILYVPDDGTLQAAIDAASPGDTIRIRGGTYYNNAQLGVEDSGTAGHYLTIEAVPGQHVILDGSEPGLNDSAADNWRLYQGNIYYTDLPWGDTQCSSSLMPNFIGQRQGADGMRYLLYKGSSEWNAFLAGPPGKAYYDCDGAHRGRLYVVTYGNDDPDAYEMYVSRKGTGLELRGADYVRIRNLEFRYFGYHGVYLNNPGADHNVIERNTFHGIGRYHVRVGVGVAPQYSSDNLIQDNHFYEYGYRDGRWPVDQVKPYAFSVAVRLSFAGPGNVIRRNTFKGGEDAINVNWQSHNTDVYDNLIEEYMGDGIEVDDQPGYNIRVWSNTLRYPSSGVSTQDGFMGDYWNTGPVYFFRNVIQGGYDPMGRTPISGDISGYYTDYGYKVGTDRNWPSRVFFYHNTISIPWSPSGPPWGGHGIQDAGGYNFSGIVARNNLWDIGARVFYLRYPTTVIDHDLDCDNLHNPTPTNFIQWSNSGGPEGNGVYHNLADVQRYTGQELHAISNNGTLFNADLSLRAGSPEIDAGCVIVGFNDRGPGAYKGQKPDIGAFEYTGKPDLSASTKTASVGAVSDGGSVAYTVRIQNTGGPFTQTVQMTDLLPAGLDYTSGTLTATLGNAWVTYATPSWSIHWQGVMSDTAALEIHYRVVVNIADTRAVPNTAWINDGSGQPISRSAIIIVNGWPTYMPIILRN